MIKTHFYSSKKLFEKGQFIFFANLLDKFVYFFLYLILGRNIPITEFGNFVTIMAFLNILFIVYDLGFGYYLQREYATNPKAEDELKLVVAIRLYLFPIFILSVLIYAIVFTNSNLLLLIFLSIAFYLNGYISLFVKVLNGRGDFKTSFMPFIKSRSVFAVLTILTIYFSNNIVYIAIPFIVSSGIEFYFLYRLVSLPEIFIQLKFSDLFSLFIHLLKKTYPFGLGMVSVILYDKIDVILINQILSPMEAGYYSVAYSFYKLPAIIPPMLLVPLFTDASQYFNVNQTLNKKKITNIFFILIGFSCTVLLIYYFGANLIITSFFGTRFQLSVDLLQLLTFSFGFLVLNNMTGVLLNAINKEKYQLTGTICGLLANIVLNVILLRIYGVKGAALSTIAAEFIVFIFQSSFLFKFMK
jgi:O-antigen/teichoic acid export membrane protein